MARRVRLTMHALDYVIVAANLIGVVWVGIRYRGRQHTVNDYFTSRGTFRGRLGTLLIGFSIAATFFSGISFIAYPSVAYTSGLKVLPVVLTLLPSYFIVRYWFLPRYLDKGWREPYEHIEEQYGRTVRYATSLLYILFRIGWMGALIYVPTLIILTTVQLSDAWFWPLILATGLTSTIYTVIGGIRGVIITDALQFLIILIGVLLTAGYVVTYIDVPAARLIADMEAADKLTVFDFSFDLSQTFTIWSMVIGLTVANLATAMGDQMSLQRYLCADNAASAANSVRVSVIGAAVVIVTLIAVGVFVAAWYRYHPDPNLPRSADQIFPYFASAVLPVGGAGLLIAAILAATMSSMTSGINALAGSITNDFYAPTHPDESQAHLLRFARWTSFGIGVAATLISGFVRHLGSIWDIAQTIGGVLFGPVFAIVLIAVIKWKVRPRALLLAMPCAVIVGVMIARAQVNTLWIIPCTTLVTFLVPWLDSLVPARAVART